MQTFLPYPDFEKSASVLDYRRLGKQRVEAYQLITLIENNSNSWRNHPARKMWEGYTDSLKVYLGVMISEWRRRGYVNNIIVPPFSDLPRKSPTFIGDERFHSSHRAALLFKDREHYLAFNWQEEPKLEYFWPV